MLTNYASHVMLKSTFNMFFKKRNKVDLTESDKQVFLAIVRNIETVLNRSQLNAQGKVVNDIHVLTDKFCSEDNGRSA